ncbi:hypothetical protein BJX64DRAFT_172477 [Aspergillus heterothallicus]
MTTVHHLPARLSPALTVREAITDAITRFLVGLDTSDKPLFENRLYRNRNPKHQWKCL